MRGLKNWKLGDKLYPHDELSTNVSAQTFVCASIFRHFTCFTPLVKKNKNNHRAPYIMLYILTVRRVFSDYRAADKNMDILKNLKRTWSYGGTPGKVHPESYIPGSSN